MSRRVVGVDVGGTFTDFLLADETGLSLHKVPSTPSDPAQAVLQGLEEMGVSGPVPVVHGSTVATNALLQRSGARTALVTTRGFEDVLEIGRQARPALYDIFQDKPEPLVERGLSLGAGERVDKEGRIVLPLSQQEALAIARRVDALKVESVAVSLLFSFLNPAHEAMLDEALRGLPSRPFISLSSQVLPEFREYERTATAVANAYVGPAMSHYLTTLGEALSGGLGVMQSSGGSISAAQAARQPVRTILSGPAGGVVGALWVASQAGFPHIITLDMGGTSTDVALCPGRIQETTSGAVGGLPLGVPIIDIHTVGAGGGSLAWIDGGGALRVGPQSAGADPGPACYGTGDQPTVTDANLLLGRLVPRHFLGGRMPLDVERAEAAISSLAEQMGIDARTAALGVVQVVNSNMERAVRAVSLERGFDPRDFTLLAFGGAGSMHACELAREMGITRVLVPRYPGVLSALGVTIADVEKEYARTVMLRGEALSAAEVDTALAPLEAQAREDLEREGFDAARHVLQRWLDARYLGQSFELPVACPATSDPAWTHTLAQEFHRAHHQRFGYSDTTQGVEVVNVRVKAIGRVEKPSIQRQPRSATRDPVALEEIEAVFADGRPQRVPIYLREELALGHRLAGPALVVQMDATTVLPPGWSAVVDELGNLVAERR